MSSFSLKLIAIMIMLVDHVGAIIFPEAIILRIIGRLAFPIFAFLIVEGFEHTSNVAKYASRLAAFAVISEIPYDLAFSKKLFDFSSQNVFITLFIGLLTLYLYKKYKDNSILALIIILTGLSTASLLLSDYSGYGVFLILMFYIFKNNKAMIFVSVLVFNILIIAFSTAPLNSAWRYIELFSILSVLIIFSYNNKKGKNLKYLFYIFYPAHLLILFAISQYMC